MPFDRLLQVHCGQHNSVSWIVSGSLGRIWWALQVFVLKKFLAWVTAWNLVLWISSTYERSKCKTDLLLLLQIWGFQLQVILISFRILFQKLNLTTLGPIFIEGRSQLTTILQQGYRVRWVVLNVFVSSTREVLVPSCIRGIFSFKKQFHTARETRVPHKIVQKALVWLVVCC